MSKGGLFRKRFVKGERKNARTRAKQVIKRLSNVVIEHIDGNRKTPKGFDDTYCKRYHRS